MCLPICEVCGKPILVEEKCIRLQNGEHDLLQEFQVSDETIIHERCLSDYAT